MGKQEIDINDYLNSFLNYFHELRKLLFDNIGTFYEMAKFLKSQAVSEISRKQFDWNKIEKSTFFKNIELIDNFFKKNNVDFDIDTIIKDGTLEVIPTNYDRVMYGLNNYLGDHKSITIYNNGYVTDTIVWIHEISHYRNQTDEGRSQVNDLLTETLAHTMSLIFTDYLEEEGFSYEANIGRHDMLITFKAVSSNAYVLTKMYLLYETLGDTSRESYKYYYGSDDDYDEVKNKFKKIVQNNNDAIFNILFYTLSGVLSVYMYEEYRKDNSFINNIEKLNTCLLNGDDLQKCLSTIGLTGYNKESLDKIEKAYADYRQLLSESKYKMLKK